MYDFYQHYERCGSTEKCVDYCLWEYPPRQAPQGKQRSYNLLLHSFAVAGANPSILEFCQRLRHTFGIGNLVWGVKWAQGKLSWELYIYDYRRLERQRSITHALRSVAPVAACDLRFSEQRPYFMFSLDLDDPVVTGAGIQEINIYMGNPGSDVSSGLCYSLTEQGLQFSNLYYFYDAKRDIDDVVGKLACSAHLDLPGLDLDAILWPEMRECGVIVLANKRDREGIYFSRVTVDQLIYFLQRMDYPEPIVQHLQSHREQFDHLLFDVGFDYRTRDGQLEISKSAYYGYF